MVPQHSNRLIDETSPYLKQHAHNPVDWYPWGDEALARARQEDKPILLSVGYSACHWCHVMERESFENEAIAALMNEHFINIKVDREERPDLDEIYMGAVQALTGSGGWPMTIFLTPDLRPFYGGTYYPPADQYGRPGFPRVLQGVAQYYRDKADQVEDNASQLLKALQQNAVLPPAAGVLGAGVAATAYHQLEQSFDDQWGGFGQAPKFPGAGALQLLLRYHRNTGQTQALHMAEHTLVQMARGGMYDQLGGGFHRYSVDERWLVPHFEKMLYDNAQLVWAYLEAFQVTGKGLYRRVVEETLGYVLREMSQPEGGYYATQDADTEGEEGKYFVWLPEEVEAVLGEEEARLFNGYYDITPQGNFEHGQSILHIDAEMDEAARLLEVDENTLVTSLEKSRARLLAVRQQRLAPGRDDKILVAWNGLMISAMARAGQVLAREEYVESARGAAAFILERMVVEGSLRHSFKDGGAPLPAYQDDYACFIVGLLDLYEATFESVWLQQAECLGTAMIERFWDADKGGFFYTEATAQDLIVRTKNPFDNATPSGNSMAVQGLVRLAAMLGNEDFQAKAEETLQAFSALLEKAPTALAHMVNGLDFYQGDPSEIALVGTAAKIKTLAAVVYRRFLPNKVLVGGQPGPDQAQSVPLLEGKMDSPDTRAYVCRRSVCSAPVDNAAELAQLLERENTL
ncbi:MAG: DUF255 domain-containing protein [Candidatus Latescibacteria bacterium]|nr:DUF255 domain-containing protein [Candidatus Latescibacterota bacterium]